jgi:anti-sigma B factor antagonist
MEALMIINIEEKSGVTVFIISGRIDAGSADGLKKKFKENNQPGNNYVFDLGGVDFIDSTGLGSIVSALKSAVESDGNVKIAALQAKPRMVFEITRAYKIFDIFDDVDSAVESYSQD